MAGYILGESQGETNRLVAQAERDSIEDRLLWAGLSPGMTAIDAGCGPGETTRAMAKLLGPRGTVHGYDLSPARIEAARAKGGVEGGALASFETGDVRNLPCPPGQADFLLCQYVLEYLPDPGAAIAAMLKLLKPGGRMLLVDGDGIGTLFWPSTPELDRGVSILLQILAKTGFDPYVGRKLFALAKNSGLHDVDVTTYAYMSAPGRVGEAEETAWRQRFQALAPLGVQAFGSESAWNLFTSSYLSMLGDDSTFKFILGVAVKGSGP